MGCGNKFYYLNFIIIYYLLSITAVNSITQKDRTSPYKFNSIEFGVTINGNISIKCAHT